VQDFNSTVFIFLHALIIVATNKKGRHSGMLLAGMTGFNGFKVKRFSIVVKQPMDFQSIVVEVGRVSRFSKNRKSFILIVLVMATQ